MSTKNHEEPGSSEPRSRPGPLKRLVFGLVYLGITTTVVLLLLEVLVRVFAAQELPHDPPDLYTPDTAIGWRRTPDKRVTANSGERDVDLCTDHRGHRIDCAADKPPCDKRVLVLGDSFVEAKAVPWSELVWARLERDTKACFDVAGVGAYGIAQYTQSLREHLTPDAPKYDLVIVNLYDGNDFSDPVDHIPPPKSVQNKPFRLLPPSWNLKGLREWAYPFNQVVERYSHFYVLLRHTIRMIQIRGDTDIWGLPNALRRSAMTDAVLDRAAKGIGGLVSLARARGLPVLLVNIPYRGMVTDPQAKRLRQGFPDIADDIDVDLVLKRFLPRLEAIDGLQVIDLTTPMRQRQVHRSWWGYRDPHLSPEGHAVWYAIIRAKVRAMLGLKPS